MENIINVKGTHDVIGSEAANYNRIEETMKSIARFFAFKEYRPPVIESSSLFQRSVGESSDVVRKEMYNFLDKSQRSITLRPEFTAGIVRSFVNNKLYATETLPVKAYYLGPVFRYERPGLGRYRQFNQFGIEVLGSNSYLDDVDAIALGYTILENLGFEKVEVLINTLGDEESRNRYKEALKEYFASHIDNMCEDCKERFKLNPLRILDCKVKEDQLIVADAPRMKDYLSDEARARFEKVCSALDALDIECVYDDTLVRGLDYYSETVFEFHYISSKGNDYGAIGAGGHYSNLVKELGGPQLDGVGFSFGIERVYSVMKDDGLLSDEEDNIELYVMPLGKESIETAYSLALSLRLSGYVTEVDLSGAKMASMFKKAEKAKADYGIILGENEIANKTVIVKDLCSKNQEEIKIDDLVQYLDDKYLASEEPCDGEDEDCNKKHPEGEDE